MARASPTRPTSRAYDLVTNSSIIAGNHLPGGAPLAEIVTVHGVTGANNLIGSANVALPGDTLGGDPMLAPLADNGGPTLTHALLAGSPAIDAGSNLGCSSRTTNAVKATFALTAQRRTSARSKARRWPIRFLRTDSTDRQAVDGVTGIRLSG